MIRRKKCGRGFSYLRDDNSRLCTKDSSDRKVRQWIKGLAIPPAWQEVLISENPDEKILAVGRDLKGKKQYIYNPEWAQRQQAHKFDRLVDFAYRLPVMRRVTAKHLKDQKMSREKVLACMLRLLDLAYFRPGSPQYTKENDTFGLTTMRSRHLSIHKGELVFSYQGKSKVEQEKRIANPLLAKIVAELDEMPGYRIFKYVDDCGRRVFVNSEDLNDYIRQIMGENFSAKDFRTWAGTALAAIYLSAAGVTEDQKLRKDNIVRCVKDVAKKLGNTPAICRENYIAPRVIDAYENGVSINELGVGDQNTKSLMLSDDESRVINLLTLDLSLAS